MKKYLTIIITFFLFSSIASASSMNGDYNGNPIVKVIVNGKELNPDVPAQIIDGKTLLPLRDIVDALEIGIEWDQLSYTANIVQKSNKDDESENVDDFINEVYSELSSELYIEDIIYSSGYNSGSKIAFYLSNPTIFTDKNIYSEFAFLLSLVAYAPQVDSSEIVLLHNTEIVGSISTFYRDSVKYVYNELSLEDYISTWDIQFVQKESHTQQIDSLKNKEYLHLYSNDGKTYLGKLTTNKYDSDSIFNEYGNYGSKYGKDSIWNEYGTYGSDYSNESAFNDHAKKPPLIMFNNKIFGYLTTNEHIKDQVSPKGIYEWLENQGY